MEWVISDGSRVVTRTTPNAPAVTQLVTNAARPLAIQPAPAPSAMIGYIKATPHAVRDQVDAIFDTLRLDYQIRYVQESVPYGGPGTTSVALQKIKLPAEVLQ